jgi:hypothetical protein
MQNLAAHVNACTYLAHDPRTPIDISFTAGNADTNCMKKTGQDAKVTATRKGLTCAFLGHVEFDDSGFCSVQPSDWCMSYSDSSGYTENLETAWSAGPWYSEITLQSYSTGTNVCSSRELCTQPTVKWSNDDNPHIWVSTTSFICLYELSDVYVSRLRFTSDHL